MSAAVDQIYPTRERSDGDVLFGSASIMGDNGASASESFEDSIADLRKAKHDAKAEREQRAEGSRSPPKSPTRTRTARTEEVEKEIYKMATVLLDHSRKTSGAVGARSSSPVRRAATPPVAAESATTTNGLLDWFGFGHESQPRGPGEKYSDWFV